MKEISLEDYFNYHPPTNENRKADHEKINEAAFSFAKIIDEFEPLPPLEKGGIRLETCKRRKDKRNVHFCSPTSENVC